MVSMGRMAYWIEIGQRFEMDHSVKIGRGRHHELLAFS